MTRRFVGVGVGPGDPELVTLKAVRVLREADVVFVPVAATGEVGRAESVVLAHVEGAQLGRLRRLRFSMDPDACERERSRDGAAAAVVDALAAGPDGMVAAFATIGDPSVYSTFTYLAERVSARLPGLAVEAVPGITAMQDLAARSGAPLVVGTERLVLLPLVDPTDGLGPALAGFDTVVCYKGGGRMPELVGAIERAGRLGDALYGARIGLPDERICPAADVGDGRAPYLSTVIVRAPRGPRPARAEPA